MNNSVLEIFIRDLLGSTMLYYDMYKVLGRYLLISWLYEYVE
jgi:hypothetical protein